MENKTETPCITVQITDTNAIVPKKAHSSDIGYDLTAIGVYKKINNQTTLYETGVIVVPPSGYYTEILPRSSISKSGYMLSNSVGIIDPDYRGSLKIALTKVVSDAKDLELPFTKCQLVLRKAEESCIRVVEDVSSTKRGTGGFGSTDKQ